jgi:hypothetical protein
MATQPAIGHSAILHREHEPLRGHLQWLWRSTCAAGRRWYYSCPRGGGIPQKQELGCRWDGKWEDLFMDVEAWRGFFPFIILLYVAINHELGLATLFLFKLISAGIEALH